MKREIYDEDHEAFRASVKQFLDREVVPHLETYADNHGLDRDFWLAAGKQGFLGLEIPEDFGGSEAGDYRFNAVLTEEPGQGQHDPAEPAWGSTPTSRFPTWCT